MADTNASDGPYVGPRPFEPEEHERFFGRDEEARAVASLVVAHRVVVLYAASGAGKTSLLNAGVVPLLEEEDGFDVLPPIRLRGLVGPDADGNPYIANALSNLARAAGETATGGDRPPPATLAGFLAARPRSRVDDEGMSAPRALIFDQFEELFTLYPQRWQQRREVFEQIADALAHDPLLRVVLAIREDFIAQLDPYASLLPTRMRTRMRLESLRRQAALAAVTGPLASERRTFAAGTAEQLVDDLLKVRVHTTRDESTEVPGELVEPVQLQVVCRTLWSSLPADVEEIGMEDLARIGSVSDVLANYYREAVRAAALAGAVPERELRDHLEAAFITPVGTRGTVVGGGDSTAGIPNGAIAELEARHLVRAEWRAGARWFELTHDSLIEPIVSSNAALRRARQARRERLLKQAVAGLLVVAGLLAGLLWAAVPGDRGDSLSRRVAVIEAHGPLAGLRLARTFTASDTPVALQPVAGGRGLIVGGSDGRIRVWDLNAGQEITTLDYGDSGLSSLAVSPDGREVLTAGRLGMRSWKTAGVGTRPPENVRFASLDERPAARERAPVTGATFDPTGFVLLVVDGRQGRLLDRLAGGTTRDRPFTKEVVRAAYSPQGSAVLGVAADGTVRLRDVTEAAAPPAMAAPVVPAAPVPAREVSLVGPERVLRAGGSIVSASFAPDGATVVTASSDGGARLWRTRDGVLLRELPVDGAALSDARFSPDGRLVATAGSDGFVRVWNTDGERIAVIHANTAPVSALSFAAGGQLLVTAGADSLVRIWANVAPRRPFAVKACSTTQYYAAPYDVGDRAARGSDGRPYIASIRCAAPVGAAVRAPERGIITGVGMADGRRRVELTTPAGRRWVFLDAIRRSGLAVGSTADAGAMIGSVAPNPNTVPGVGVELWETGKRGHRMANLWNPSLFLGLPQTQGSLAYPGDNAPRDARARWMGSGAEAAGLPPELPIMASLVTSGLLNLRGGDGDSVGFFQMRLSVWNTGPYAGFRKRPALQLKWFLDTASQVRERRLVHGERDPAADPKRYGRWAADVIHPAQEYRGRFQLRLGEARRLLGRSGREPFRPAPGRSAAKRAAGAMQSDQTTAAPPTCPGCYRSIGARALRAALSVRGRPYTWGGNRPGTGFDASGLVQWAYGRAGARLPRIIDDQLRFGRAARRSSLRPGDIVFFRDPAGYVNHVGLYAGDERFVHAPHTGDVVRVSSLRVPYYAQQYAGARHLG